MGFWLWRLTSLSAAKPSMHFKLNQCFVCLNNIFKIYVSILFSPLQPFNLVGVMMNMLAVSAASEHPTE